MSCADLTWFLILRGFVGAVLFCALLLLRASVCALLSARFCLARFCYGAVKSMWKLTSLFDYVLYPIVYITGDRKKNIDKSKISVTLKQHWFEVVDFEILEFEGT